MGGFRGLNITIKCDTREQRHVALASTFMKKTVLLYSLLHCECVLQVTNASARCDSSWFLSWWTGRGKSMGGWPAIPKTYLQGIQTTKSHSYASFLSALRFIAVVPSVLQSHLFDLCLLGKTSSKKDVRKDNLICPVLFCFFYFALYTCIFWLWSL